MKVYVVRIFDGEYHDMTLEAIFDSFRKADEYRKTDEVCKATGEECVVEEWEVK